MRSSATPPTSDVSRPNARRLGTIVVGIAVLGLGGFFYLDSRDAQHQLSSQVQQNADLQKQLEILAETVSEIKTSKLYRQEEQTIARDASLSALQMGAPHDSWNPSRNIVGGRIFKPSGRIENPVCKTRSRSGTRSWFGIVRQSSAESRV